MIYLIQVERCKASTSTSAIGNHMVCCIAFSACFLTYIFTGQLNSLVSMNFTLHSELRASVPEFTITCRTHGGPATTVQWTVNGVPVQEDRYHETSQLILDTSLNSVYDNRLRVRGRRNGSYNCTISNNIRDYLDEGDVSVTQVNRTLNISGNVLKNKFDIYSSLHLLTQLQKSQAILLQSSQSPTLHMSIWLCLGSHQVIMTQLAMSSTTSLREDQSSVTGCLEERQTHTHWMVFREESPTTSP